jgi:hypothetical protein
VKVTRQHFTVADTVDSDAGTKNCLTLGGQWTAASKDDRDVVHERVRQRVGQLRMVADQMRSHNTAL